MGKVYSAPAFSVGERWYGANAFVRHSLSMAHLDTPVITRVRTMLDTLKIKYTSPVWRENCWAHFGLTHKNTAIMVQGNRDMNRETKFREVWATYRWTLISISERSLERLSDADMALQFTSALKSLGKMKCVATK